MNRFFNHSDIKKGMDNNNEGNCILPVRKITVSFALVSHCNVVSPSDRLHPFFYLILLLLLKPLALLMSILQVPRP